MNTAQFQKFPVVAILRGIKPEEVEVIAELLYENGVRCIEVPLNSPSPMESIGALARIMPADCLVGAGTVLSADAVSQVHDVGGRLIVTPNLDAEVVARALQLNLEIAPGIATPTEAFRAIKLGCQRLKLFPASSFGCDHLKAMLAVLPADVQVLAVGGIGASDFDAWLAAGAIGFGIGSEMYRAGDRPEDVLAKVKKMRAAYSG